MSLGIRSPQPVYGIVAASARTTRRAREAGMALLRLTPVLLLLLIAFGAQAAERKQVATAPGDWRVDLNRQFRAPHDPREIIIVTDPQIKAGAVACRTPGQLRDYLLAAETAASPQISGCVPLGNVPYAFVMQSEGIAEISPIVSGEWGNVPIVYTQYDMLQLD